VPVFPIFGFGPKFWVEASEVRALLLGQVLRLPYSSGSHTHKQQNFWKLFWFFYCKRSYYELCKMKITKNLFWRNFETEEEMRPRTLNWNAQIKSRNHIVVSCERLDWSWDRMNPTQKEDCDYENSVVNEGSWRIVPVKHKFQKQERGNHERY